MEKYQIVHVILNINLIQRATCIKGLFWPPVEPKTESCFSQLLLIGLLDEKTMCKRLAFI